MARADIFGRELIKWGHEQTEKYIDDLAAAFDLLTTKPRLGKSCDNIRPGYRKHPTLRHVIYYREVDYGIEVIRVLLVVQQGVPRRRSIVKVALSLVIPCYFYQKPVWLLEF